MVPLDLSGRLVLTVWDYGAAARVLFIRHNTVKVVMNGESDNSWPQAVVPEGAVLLYRGRQIRGNTILPTSVQLWQWNWETDMFQLEATASYDHRYAELARFLDRN
jgi:hypothetical protein